MNQDMLFRLFEQASTAIVIYRQEQGICYINPRALTLLKTERESLYERPLHTLFPKDHNRELFERLRTYHRSFTYPNATLCLHDRSRLHTDLSVQCLRRSEQGLSTFQINLYPAPLTTTTNPPSPDTGELMQVLRQHTDMPLSALDKLTQQLLEKTPRQDQLPLLQSMQQSEKQLRSTVQNILLYAELVSDTYNPSREEFSPLQIIEEQRTYFQPMADKQRNRLTVSADLSHECYEGDAAAFSQMIRVVLDNALHSTQNGQVKIEVSSGPTDHHQILIDTTVTGSREGAPADLLEDDLALAAQEAQDSQPGSLGREIVQLLAEKCGGRFTIQNEPDGSRAQLQLPYRAVATPHRQSATTDLHGNPLKGLRLLYVEDLLPNHFLMEGLCAIWGINLDTAFNGREALGKFHDHAYDIILMDLNMPLMNGYDTSLKIRNTADRRKQAVPIIAVSGSISPEGRHNLRDYGIDDILSKPIQPDKLYQKLTSYVNF